MAPMFAAGDIAVVTPTHTPRPGRPVLVRLADQDDTRCRIWLDAGDDTITLGRLRDGAEEHLATRQVAWALEVLYRLAPAA